MNKKKSPSNNTGTLNTRSHSNSFTAQRLRVRDALIEAGSRGQTTIELRENLDVIHAPARVLELRQQGFSILTKMEKDQDAFGRTHRVGRYFLISLPKRMLGVSS